ncbi:MAG: hypothetical protein QM539_06385 [Alphaproteobacteria bacterium]|nr:hypothetical protein [Alphaproteobacteria bacterium]
MGVGFNYQKIKVVDPEKVLLKSLNVVTKDHFYHNGANLENRRTVVEALVCNFDTHRFEQHNHGLKEKTKLEQLEFEW